MIPWGTETGASSYHILKQKSNIPNRVFFKYQADYKASSLAEQKSPIAAPKFPSEVAKLLNIPQQDFSKIPKKFMELTFRNIIL